MRYYHTGPALRLSLSAFKKSVIKLKAAIYIAAFFNKKIYWTHRLKRERRHYMSENTTFTQEELNKIVSERIKRAQAKTEELENRVKELEKERAGLLSTIEANNQLLIEKDGLISAKEAEFAELQKVSDEYKASQLKAQIAVRNGLPYDLAERLQGSDEESLQADAERLSAFVKPKQVIAPMKSNEPEVDSRTASMQQVLQQLNL